MDAGTAGTATTAGEPGGLLLRTREIAPRIQWVSYCGQAVEGGISFHLHGSSSFVIRGTSATLLVDAGSPRFERALEDVLDDMIGPQGPDWVFPTHLEQAHAGGLERFAHKYPNAKIIADAHDYQLYFPELLPRLKDVRPGDSVDLGGGYRFHFLKAVLKDLSSTLWGYEESQQVMFVADGFNYLHHPDVAESVDGVVHLPEECTKLLSEIAEPPSPRATGYLTKAAFWWTQHRQIGPFIEEINGLLERYPTKLIAPAHGGGIDDIDLFMPILAEGYDVSYASGAVRK